MNLSFFIAKRYLISKKTNNAINIISWISIVAIAVTTAALVVILSAMNGLTGAVAGLYNSLEPDLKIISVNQKYFELDQSTINKIKNTKGVELISFTYSDKALLKNGDKQSLVSVKAVDSLFNKVTKLDSTIIDGFNCLNGEGNNIVIGQGIAANLYINIMEYSSELSLLSPKKGKSGGLSPEDEFNQVHITPCGVFSINDEFDYQFVFINKSVVEKLFEDNKRYSAIEIKCDGNEDETKEELNSLLGKDFSVKNRYELNDVLFKTLETEKMATFIILAFILVIATFNIIGALTMLIIEKKKDIKTLFSLGADISLVRNIFMREGFLITGVGAISGLLIGLFVCWLQIKYHFVKFGDEFIIPYYPIEIQFSDLINIIVVIMLIGFFAALYPVRFFTKKSKLY
ncbi:MAG: FtsX-like permease family protein [Bacteroidia bacterium]